MTFVEPAAILPHHPVTNHGIGVLAESLKSKGILRT
jgi:hypothetical protein